MEEANADLLLKLYELNEIGISLSRETDSTKLFETILMGAITLTQADAGTLYTVNEKGELQFEVLHNASMGLHFNRESGGNNPFENLPLTLDGHPNDKLVACHAALHDRIVNIDDVYQEASFDFSGTKAFDKQSGYHCKSLLAVPMKDHQDTMIGVLQIINPMDPITKQKRCFSKQDEHVLRSLASQAAVMLTQMYLIRDLQKTFQGFIEAIGEAIDKKSTHTGKHCQRVPIITMLFAHALNNSQTPPFDQISFTEEELYELKLAALLHDCGKVATPIHIIDKHTRLELVTDRIALIHTRASALKAQLKVQQLEGTLSKESYQQKIKQLDEDLQFISQANHGSTFMDEDKKSKLLAIAQQTWIDEQGTSQPLITEEEIENLSISKGTLNDQERQIIQDHAANTVDMLKHLPLPKHLKNIPHIAGSHHERIDGKGYPNGLTGNQMSTQAKMLAIADVFEALTAPDRPYKSPLPLSKALNILSDMSKEGHLDPTLTELFIKERVHLQYAKKHLSKNQIDC